MACAMLGLTLMPASAMGAPKESRWLTATEIASHRFDALRNTGVKIERIGIVGGDALVFTTKLEDDAPMDYKYVKQVYSIWRIYSLHSTDSPKLLVTGYQASVIGWVGFSSTRPVDLAVSLLSCNECEPALVLTAFHHDNNLGWEGFWLQAGHGTPYASAVLKYDELDFNEYEKPYDQVVALLDGDGGRTILATWLHTGKSDKGEVQDQVYVYKATPLGDSSAMEIRGQEAYLMKRRICSSKRLFRGVTIGRVSESCRQIRAAMPAK